MPRRQHAFRYPHFPWVSWSRPPFIQGGLGCHERLLRGINWKWRGSTFRLARFGPPAVAGRRDRRRGQLPASEGRFGSRGVPSSCKDRMTDSQLIEAAVAGEESAFAELVQPHRRPLHAHCYRMLGSVQDAEDAVQETLLRAWRGLPSFQGRSSLRTWLLRSQRTFACARSSVALRVCCRSTTARPRTRTNRSDSHCSSPSGSSPIRTSGLAPTTDSPGRRLGTSSETSSLRSSPRSSCYRPGSAPC